MCEYCEKEKHIEERKKDNIYFKVWGKHLQVIGKVLNIPLGRDVIINYCPMCRKKVRRLKSMEDEELDIPIKDRNKQLELGICMECGKRKAKYLCDYITGKTFDLYGKGKIEPSTCDKYLCEKCTNKLNGKDYCKEHIKQLKEELKDIKLGDD